MDKLFVSASQYGVFPDTGKDAAPQIRRMIEENADKPFVTIQLESGEYILEEDHDQMMLLFANCLDMTLRGAVNDCGEPATTLRIRQPLQNDAPGKGFIEVSHCQNIAFENLIFDYTQRFSSAGRVLQSDSKSDRVVVEVFEGQSHFPGMKCYSANSWNLKTGDLFPVSALTIGVDKSLFSHVWKEVPGTENRTYEIQGMKFADKVAPGDGISWHFNVIGAAGEKPHVFYITDSENIRIENIRIYSCVGAAIVCVADRNITMREVIVKPEGTSLAVSPRDFAWLVGTSGKLMVDHVYVKGVRWDPFNIHSALYPVTDISQNRTHIKIKMPNRFQTFCSEEDSLTFWRRHDSIDLSFLSMQKAEDGFEFEMKDTLPDDIGVGDYVTPCWMTLEEAIIRNTTIEGNCGTGILFQDKNLTIENCVFRNNTYDDIGLGPIDNHEGCFVRKAVIRNNQFDNSTWVNKFYAHDGAISVFNGYMAMQDCDFNREIIIEQNQICNHRVGISIRNAACVCIRNNQMEHVEKEVWIGTPQEQLKEN